jgi:hypothetical protein
VQGACIAEGQTFRVDIESFGKKVTNDYRLEVFRRLEVISFDSQVRLKARVWSCAACRGWLSMQCALKFSVLVGCEYVKLRLPRHGCVAGMVWRLTVQCCGVFH